MRTAYLQTTCASVTTTRCLFLEGPQVNKFEKVSNVDHQMSVARGVGARSDVGGTLPCDLSHDAFDVTYPLLQ